MSRALVIQNQRSLTQFVECHQYHPANSPSLLIRAQTNDDALHHCQQQFVIGSCFTKEWCCAIRFGSSGSLEICARLADTHRSNLATCCGENELWSFAITLSNFAFFACGRRQAGERACMEVVLIGVKATYPMHCYFCKPLSVGLRVRHALYLTSTASC